MLTIRELVMGTVSELKLYLAQTMKIETSPPQMLLALGEQAKKMIGHRYFLPRYAAPDYLDKCDERTLISVMYQEFYAADNDARTVDEENYEVDKTYTVDVECATRMIFLYILPEAEQQMTNMLKEVTQ